LNVGHGGHPLRSQLAHQKPRTSEIQQLKTGLKEISLGNGERNILMHNNIQNIRKQSGNRMKCHSRNGRRTHQTIQFSESKQRNKRTQALKKVTQTPPIQKDLSGFLSIGQP
jgi:hypothetical protein